MVNTAETSSNGEFDDVEDFVSEDDDQIKDLMQKGNKNFRDNRLEDSINCYSQALVLKPGDPIILSNRSAAFARISTFLKERSTADPEYRPVNGLDRTILAELALKDAEKVINIRNNSAKSYFLKASALILLERYDDAHETLLYGIQIDPLSNRLQLSLSNLEEISAGSTKRKLEAISGGSTKRIKHGSFQDSEDFECTICFKLLYEPITTPCGHSFCRGCLIRLMDHGNNCPICRTVLFINPRTCSISATLNNIIQEDFPDAYKARKREHETLPIMGAHTLPLLVTDVVLPCPRLKISESQDRLMVRRIMEGNHRMGMVAIDSATNSIADFACEVEITECEPLPDGCFYLKVEGRRRCRILHSWIQDGYYVAEVEWVQDIGPSQGTREREDQLGPLP